MPTQWKLGLLALLCFSAWCASAQTLTHRYSFKDTAGSSTFADSVGSATGSLNNTTAGNPNSASLDGTQLVMDGTGGYATLPVGLINGYTQLTVEFWTDVNSSQSVWTRIFSFGDQNGTGQKNSGVDYCPFAGGNYQNLDMLSTNGVDAYANNPATLVGLTNVHVTVVVDPVNQLAYYYNGLSIVSAQHNTIPSLTQMNDTFNLLGRSLYDVDPTLFGNLHEFRIYQGVVSTPSVALNDAAGPGQYLTSPGTITALHFSSPQNPIFVHQTSQQNVTGDFTAVSGLNLAVYGGATYSSGNTNILTINTNGVVTGVAVGTTTIVATYGALSVTNSLTVVSLPTTLAHRYSFTSDANDSIGGANGTFVGTAAVSGGQLVLDGNGYVSLPGNLINISNYPAVTFEAWTSIGDTPQWSHLFEFGNITANNIYCAPRADAGGFHEFGLSEGGGVTGGQTLSWAHGWSNVTLHITGVVDPTTSTLAVYTNGILMVASDTANAPLTLIGTNNATLGQSSYGDPDAILSLDEFRIYNGALSPAQVAKSDLSGPNSTNVDPGALSSITVVASSYPAFSQLVAPAVMANYANLANFNLMPNVYARANGLVVTSSDPTILSVNGQNLLTTHRPGTVTLSATYLGKSSSATVEVQNQAVLSHRYSFTTDASDSVGSANGTLVGTANVSGGQLQLDGGSGDYVNLPGGLLSTYQSATMDIWATISPAQEHWARLFEFADIGPANANELYFAPAWNASANATAFSFGVPYGGAFFSPAGPTTNQVHLTCLVGNGSADVYTNGVLYLSGAATAPVTQVGTVGSWIGFSPYADPGITGSVDEYRIYQGRLSVEEIVASDLLGPNSTLSTSPSSLKASISGGNIILSWPLANAGFSVQSKPSLTSGNWVTLTNAPVVVGTQWQVSLPNSGGAQFFRLWR